MLSPQESTPVLMQLKIIRGLGKGLEEFLNGTIVLEHK